MIDYSELISRCGIDEGNLPSLEEIARNHKPPSPQTVTWHKDEYRSRWDLDGYGYIEKIPGKVGFKWVFGHRWTKPEYSEFIEPGCKGNSMAQAARAVESRLVRVMGQSGVDIIIEDLNYFWE